MDADTDLYEILGIPRTASKAEVKKSYHKAALSSHPDKKPESERHQAEIDFKRISKAYEILSEDQTRSLYDEHGMAAFEQRAHPGTGPGPEMDMEDIFAQMFGGAGAGASFPGMNGGGPRAQNRKGDNVSIEYDVTLQDLFKGKSTKFTNTKRVLCSHCNGNGGKESATPKKCGTCDGKGTKIKLVPLGPGLVTQETVNCSTCNGRGSFYLDKDKCKKCKGQRTTEQRKILDLYVPRGARAGERIVFENEADQAPDQEPGNIVFVLVQKEHHVFIRKGDDLAADLNITLAEALAGFNRTVLTHLDGRGIALNVQQPKGKILRPGQILRIKGEGMPRKKSDYRGDLYLTVKVEFPSDGWIKDSATVDKIKALFPTAESRSNDTKSDTDLVDEVTFESVPDLSAFGHTAGSFADDDADDEDGAAGGEVPGCAQQ